MQKKMLWTAVLFMRYCSQVITYWGFIVHLLNLYISVSFTKLHFAEATFINCEDSKWVKCGHGNTQLESFGSCSFALFWAHCLKWLTSVPLYDSIRQPLEQNLDFPHFSLYDSCWRYLIFIYNFHPIMLCIFILRCYPNTQQTLIHCNKCKWTVVNK